MKEIGYFQIPRFFLEVEKVIDRTLSDKSVVIAPINSDRSKIWELSPKASEAGIKEGMSVAIAKKLDRSLIVLQPKPDLYNRANRSLMKEFQKKLPCYEFEQEGKIYFDYAGMEKLYGKSYDFSNRFRKEIKNQLGLNASVGIGTNKLISKTAAKHLCPKEEIIFINEGREKKALSPLHTTVLPPINELKKTAANGRFTLLRDLNLKQVKDLHPLSLNQLEIAFEDHAALIFEMSQGIDYREVTPHGFEQSILEEFILKTETNHYGQIKSYLFELILKATNELSRLKKFSRKLTISIRYNDFKFNRITKNLKYFVRYPSELEDIAYKTLDKLLTRRCSIRYISIELSELTSTEIQLDLFDSHPISVLPNKKSIESDKLIEKINSRFPGKLRTYR